MPQLSLVEANWCISILYHSLWCMENTITIPSRFHTKQKSLRDCTSLDKLGNLLSPLQTLLTKLTWAPGPIVFWSISRTCQGVVAWEVSLFELHAHVNLEFIFSETSQFMSHNHHVTCEWVTPTCHPHLAVATSLWLASGAKDCRYFERRTESDAAVAVSVVQLGSKCGGRSGEEVGKVDDPSQHSFDVHVDRARKMAVPSTCFSRLPPCCGAGHMFGLGSSW